MTENAPWRLEDFVDSLVVELDKTRETLAVKAINKPLSYSVKEVALDVNAFPSYDGHQVRFLTAQPGEEGASKLTIQLNSITDQQVRATTKLTAAEPGETITDLGVDDQTKAKLRKIGVSTLDDLEQLERRKVDLREVTDAELDYSSLARKIQKARRTQQAPTVEGVSLSTSEGRPCLLIEGDNLAVDPTFPPVAVVNEQLAEVLSSGPGHVTVRLESDTPLRTDNEVILTCDPYAVIKVNVKA